ncbi:nuclear transport factor 2 family protein [Croceicoccus sp. BE223]|uniref:nuclear transport factor 2 family protein n=1 Tax=Croceicoccus sp. BE223 TaxID=2817716 RepID=UPI00285C39E2|nr:nuclear transport factor 2 family protein [Croceicoccus sp. BE223]MDR7103642.1 ketosteroid isomerase-like protein [Croceicoccus sp. BE223]
MSHTDARQTILDFFDDLNAGRHEQAFARFSPDVEYQIVAAAPYGATVDRAGLAAVAAEVFAELAEPLQTTVGLIIAQGEHVVAEVTSHAKTRRGGSYDNRYLFIYRVKDGLIVEGREYFDSATYIALMEGRS